MTGEDTPKGRKHRLSLLLQRGEITAQPIEDDGAGGAAEAAGDLLLDLDHAQVAFGLGACHRRLS